MMRLSVAAVAALSLSIAACGEKPQAQGSRKVEGPAWQGAQASAFSAPAWKPGDQASWEAQMRARAGNQNEYARTAPGPK